MANHKSGAYNDRMRAIHENARQLERERLKRGEMPNPSLTSPEEARKYGWEITGREVKKLPVKVLVIVEGGIVQEVLSHHVIDEYRWDWNDFEDAPVEYWEERDEEERALLKELFNDAVYQGIVDSYNEAKAQEQEDERAICFGDVPDTSKGGQS